METSLKLYVTPSGLMYHVFDTYSQREVERTIWGLRDDWGSIVWKTKKGPPLSVTPEWLRTEDGMDFQKFMDENKDSFTIDPEDM